MRTGRRMWRVPGLIEKGFIRTEGDRRQQHPVASAGVRKLALERSIIGLSKGSLAECRRWIVAPHRKIKLPLIPDDERGVVGDEREEERERIGDGDEQEGVVAAPDPPKLAQAPLENRFRAGGQNHLARRDRNRL